MYALNIVHTLDIKITQTLPVTAATTPAPNESSAQLSAGQTYVDAPAAIALLRAYSPGAGDHFYTTDAVEMANATANLGYSSEGTACHVLASAVGETIPLYRMYSPSARDHFYTTSKEEADNAAKNYGYINEGTAAYVYPSQSCRRVPLYRAYSRRAADHFYTTSKSERDNAITNLGYVDEGIACYVDL